MVDYSRPAADGVFDGADFEKFLHDRIKVDNKAGQLGEKVKVTRDGKLTTFFVTGVADKLYQETTRLLSPPTYHSQSVISNI